MTAAELNINLATILRNASDIREKSWDGERYGLTNSDAAEQACSRDNPLSIIMGCLLTAGYCDMWDFCDIVLGKAEG